MNEEKPNWPAFFAGIVLGFMLGGIAFGHTGHIDCSNPDNAADCAQYAHPRP